MSQFSRRARWLRDLFPASVIPQQVDPNVVSDDVSLVQQYDGGGIGMALATFPTVRDGDVLDVADVIVEPELATREWITRSGINVNTELCVLATGLYARILGVSCIIADGGSPTRFTLVVGAPTGTGLSEHRQNITATIPEIFNQVNALPLAFDIIPPGFQLNASQVGGLAATQIRVDVTWIVAPIGAIIIGTSRSGMQPGVAN